jgi:hypothetical protein
MHWKASMSESKDTIDAEVSEMLEFYRAAAVRVDHKKAAGLPPQQTEETEYVPARSQRPPLCRFRSTGRIANRGSRGWLAA